MLQKLVVLMLVTLVIVQSYIEPVAGRCDFNCPNNIEYVCGTDSVTYQNDCFLRRAKCETGMSIAVDSEGSCSSSSTSSSCPESCDAIEDEEVNSGNCDKFSNVCELKKKFCRKSKTKVLHKNFRNCNKDDDE